MALRDQHAIDLAQDRVGIGGELKRVRQQRRIDAVTEDRQLRGSGQDVGPSCQGGHGHQALAARAAAGQEFPCRPPGPNLQQFPAEDILQRCAEQLRLRGQQRAAERRGPPPAESGVTVLNA